MGALYRGLDPSSSGREARDSFPGIIWPLVGFDEDQKLSGCKQVSLITLRQSQALHDG